jgi:hypothetical protein
VVSGVFGREQIVERKDHHETEIGRRNADVDDKLQEVLHVAVSDAIVHPWTMVVHLEDAEAALTAAMGSWRLPCLLDIALLDVIDFKVLRLEWRSHSFLDFARIGKRRPQVRENSQQTCSIECEEVKESLASQWYTLDKHGL